MCEEMRMNTATNDSGREHEGKLVPLFVRIPSEQAQRLSRVSFERGRSKQALVSEMVERYLHVQAQAHAGAKAHARAQAGAKAHTQTHAGAGAHARGQARRRRYTVEALEPEDMQVGHASFRSYEEQPSTEPEVLSAQEAAALLKVERALVERLAAAGELPGRELGGEWRFARAALIEWLAQPAKQPAKA
jgi:excisionase family DNA binding protein